MRQTQLKDLRLLFVNTPVHQSVSRKGNLMLRILTVVTFFLLCASVSQAQSPNLMSDAEYKAFLSQVEAVLPKWETALKGIDLEKVPYSIGKPIADSQTLGLTEVDNIRTFIHLQRQKRTVYGEVALKGFMDSLFDMGEEIVWREAIMGVTLSTLDKYGADLSALNMRLSADAMERVDMLEKGTCHP